MQYFGIVTDDFDYATDNLLWSVTLNLERYFRKKLKNPMVRVFFAGVTFALALLGVGFVVMAKNTFDIVPPGTGSCTFRQVSGHRIRFPYLWYICIVGYSIFSRCVFIGKQ